jgi:CubicO group peptidase (beta-lactamase class C family)
VKAFEIYAEGLLKRYGVPGVAAAASRDGGVVYARGFGSADVERGISVGPDTVFGVASVTKSFTAAAITRLAETGRLTVEDPVMEYMPEFRMPRGDAAAIRIHHFLTHTPGFPPLPSRWYAFGASARADPDGTTPPVSVDARPPIGTPEDLMAYLAGDDWTPLGPPGAQFSYCNEGYALLGAIVARVSGRSYIRYVTEEILEPAGLRRTAFGPAPPWPSTGATPAGNVATPYIVRKGNGGREIVPARTWWYSDTWNPAGGICSTVTDLLRYLELYRTGGTVGPQRILSPHSVAATIRPHLMVGPGQGYGYGLGVLPDYRGGPLIEHGGGRRSISAHVAVAPFKGLAVAALANLADAPVRALAHGLLNALQDVAPEMPAIAFPDFACPEERLAAYAGEYRSREGTVLRIAPTDGRLAIEADGDRLSGRPVGPHAFAVDTRGTEQYVRFLIGEGDRARAVAYGGRIIARTA